MKLCSGHYAIKDINEIIHYYKLNIPVEGKYKNYIFVSVQASDEYYVIKDIELRKNIIAILSLDPIKAMMLYGTTIKQCAICSKTLTNDTSRKRGIGDICYERIISMV